MTERNLNGKLPEIMGNDCKIMPQEEPPDEDPPNSNITPSHENEGV